MNEHLHDIINVRTISSLVISYFVVLLDPAFRLISDVLAFVCCHSSSKLNDGNKLSCANIEKGFIKELWI
jgi:hypothetical protein